MKFAVRGTISSGVDALDYAITDLRILNNGNQATVFATSGPNGGLSTYSLTGTGTASFVDHALFNPNWQAGISDQIAIIADGGGGLSVVIGMTDSVSLGAISVSSAGDLGAVSTITGLDASTIRPAMIAVTGQGDLLIARAPEAGDGFSLHQIAGAALTDPQVLSDSDTAHLSAVSAFADATVDGTNLLFAASGSEHGVTSFRASDAGFAFADASGPEQGVGIMSPTAMQTIAVGGTTYLLVASAMESNGALSVFEVDSAGMLTARDHVIDTRDTRFGGVQDIAVAQASGMTFVVAGGGDDGLSLFTLLPGGRLQHLDSIADTATTGLANISAITATVIGETLRIVAASQGGGELTDLAVDLGGLGIQRTADPAGEVFAGTGGADILIGGNGIDRLDGGDGDDIIVDGPGRDRLTGGAGRDTFVLVSDGEQDVILDFNPAFDRLDLSSWPMFHDPESLVVTSNNSGAEVIWRDEILTLRGPDLTPLSPDAVRAAVIEGVNRPMMDLSAFQLQEAPEPEPGGEGDQGDTEDPGEPDTPQDPGPGDEGDGSDGDPGPDQPDVGDPDAPPEPDPEEPEDPEDELYLVAPDENEVRGSEQDDRLSGTNGKDVIFGEAGGDVIFAGKGSDRAFGGPGADKIRGQKGPDFLYGEDGDDRIWGQAGLDYLYGGAGDDRLWGGGKDDWLHGGTGDDRLYGGGGHDHLYGDEGHDQLWGHKGNDHLHGGDGDDHLDGGDGDDWLYGGPGQDSLHGGDGDDQLYGDAGDDELSGDGGNDLLYGGDGEDRIYGGNGNDRAYGGAGNDSLHGGDGDDELYGEAGDDALAGDNGNDRLEGGDGDDRLWGGNGHDWLYGGAGNDSLYGGRGRDQLYGEDGHDQLWGEGGHDSLYGGDGDDDLWGGNGKDQLFGGAGNDRLFGGNGRDLLEGGDGDDELNGGRGRDELFGGAGADVFVFERKNGRDTLYDFNPAEDVLRFEGLTEEDVSLQTRTDHLFLNWNGGSAKLLGLEQGDFDLSMIDFV